MTTRTPAVTPKEKKPQHRFGGILLHPTSLPGLYGIGDIGHSAERFVDFLVAAGQQWWQIMPLGPTGFGDSPYQCFSAFAGNPYLISLDALADAGLLDKADLAACPAFPVDKVDYGPVIEFHLAMLKRAYLAFSRDATRAQQSACQSFAQEQSEWLDDYAAFMACKDAHGGRVWSEWSFGKGRLHDSLPKEYEELHDYHVFLQWIFDHQWRELKSYANEQGIRIIGDMPIYVAYDSADVWGHPELFHVDERGHLTLLAGVPPDYFSETGQLWGNPVYDWSACKANDYKWWMSRFHRLLDLCDVVRIDHFRGFSAGWAVPAGSTTAEDGEWLPAPGKAIFKRVKKEFGDAPLLAEDLGVITPDVEELRDKFKLPGMRILQFAFGEDAENQFLPHNYPERCVAYTGSHDNDTTLGWYTSLDSKTQDHVRRYLGRDGHDIAWDMIRAVYASVANYALIPLQDVLSLGSEARMNYPGREQGNWQWRYTEGVLTDFLAGRLRDLAELYGRWRPAEPPPETAAGEVISSQ
jgi:4-alpha-glucanotransferase